MYYNVLVIISSVYKYTVWVYCVITSLPVQKVPLSLAGWFVTCSRDYCLMLMAVTVAIATIMYYRRKARCLVCLCSLCMLWQSEQPHQLTVTMVQECCRLIQWQGRCIYSTVRLIGMNLIHLRKERSFFYVQIVINSLAEIFVGALYGDASVLTTANCGQNGVVSLSQLWLVRTDASPS